MGKLKILLIFNCGEVDGILLILGSREPFFNKCSGPATVGIIFCPIRSEASSISQESS
jgi:hypothetical protein